MACIKIVFPRVGLTTSTWVADEHWDTLSTQQKTALIHKYVKECHASTLNMSVHAAHKTAPNFKWSEL